jgi:hypothetical protein
MFATFDEVDLERELVSRLTGNQRLWLRTWPVHPLGNGILGFSSVAIVFSRTASS